MTQQSARNLKTSKGDKFVYNIENSSLNVSVDELVG